MAILQGIETRQFEDHRFSVSPMWFGNGLGEDLPTEVVIPRLDKVVFKFTMVLVRDPYENRYLNNDNENDWFRHQMSNHLELEDPSGKLMSLDEIYLEKHHLPTHLRQDERVACHPDYLIQYLQNRNFNLYVNIGNFNQPKRMKLINPIITRLDKSQECFPGTYLEDTSIPDRYRGRDLRYTLDFEILCDAYQEVPVYNAATIQQVIKETFKKNITSTLTARQDILTIQASIAEMKARETLRDMLSEKEYRKYLTNGFVMVRGDSGRYYQVFNKQKHLRVYEYGKFIKELCIHTDAKEVPPTDHVLNMKIMIECDEQSIWDNSNLYEPSKKIAKVIEENSNIIDLFSKLKKDRHFLNDRIERKRQRMENEFFRDYA